MSEKIESLKKRVAACRRYYEEVYQQMEEHWRASPDYYFLNRFMLTQWPIISKNRKKSFHHGIIYTTVKNCIKDLDDLDDLDGVADVKHGLNDILPALKAKAQRANKRKTKTLQQIAHVKRREKFIRREFKRRHEINVSRISQAQQWLDSLEARLAKAVEKNTYQNTQLVKLGKIYDCE